MKDLLKLAKIRDVRWPEYGTQYSAGIDFFIPEDLGLNLYIAPGDDILIPSGIKANIPEGYALIAKNKSGIATSFGAMRRAGKEPKDTQPLSSLIIGASVIDSDYQGEIHIHLINTGKTEVILKPGMKIAQFIMVPVMHPILERVEPENLYNFKTERGDGGFGSTNK